MVVYSSTLISPVFHLGQNIQRFDRLPSPDDHALDSSTKTTISYDHTKTPANLLRADEQAQYKPVIPGLLSSKWPPTYLTNIMRP